MTFAVTQPDYIAALLSIIIGLGLTDLAKSLRELVRPQRRVDWHWLPLLWAATTFLLAIQVWWNSFSFLKGATSEFFFPYLTAFLLLYLTCAFALPDPEWEKPWASPEESSSPGSVLDLKAFYFSTVHRRWFFGVFIALIVTSQIGSQTARAVGEGFGINQREILTNGASVVLFGTLILTDRWWIHVPISMIYFLAVGWGTVSSIFGF